MRRLLPLVLAVLLAVTLLPGMGAIAPLDWREARDAEAAREAVSRNEWLTPMYAREAFFEKPIVGYAPEVAALRSLTHNRRHLPSPQRVVVVSRLLRALLAATLALLIAGLGERCFGTRAGWLAGCALASMTALPLAARADGTQLLATLWAWFAIGQFLQLAQLRARAPDLSRVLGWFALGAALVTGGPLPALWPLAGFALYFALARRRQGWRELRPVAGLAIVAGMALPWYGAMTALHGTWFLARVPWFPYAAETRGAWYAGALLAFSSTLVIAFPWTPLLGAALTDAAARLQRPRGDEPQDLRESGHIASLLVALMVAGALPIVLYPEAPLTAALPAMPAIALLCGRFVDRVLEGDVEARHLASATRFAAALGTTAALLAMMLAPRMAEAAAPLRLLAVVLLLAGWAPFLADLLGRRRLAAALFMLPVALGTPLLTTRILPAAEDWLDARPIAEAMQRVAPPRAALVLLEPPPPSLRLELARNLVVAADPRAAIEQNASRDGETYLAFRPTRERDAAHAAPAPLEILRRTPALVLARVRVNAPDSRP